MRVLIDVRAWADVPDDTNLSALAMTLQDSPAVLDEYLNQNGREVIVHSAPSPCRPPEQLDQLEAEFTQAALDAFPTPPTRGKR